MTPKTPSRFSYGFALATPQTPRYGAFEDSDVPRKLFKIDGTGNTCNDTNHHLTVPQDEHYDATHRDLIDNKSIIVPLTPADTPVNRKRTIEAIGSGSSSLSASRVLFPRTTPVRGSGRAYHSRQTPVKRRTNIITDGAESSRSYSSPPSVKRSNFEIFDDVRAFKREVNNENPFVPASKRASVVETSTQKHPHIPMPLDVPGMWYVFRGKKIFRPFPKGDDSLASIKPRRLFETATGSSTLSGRNAGMSDSEDDTDHEELPPARRKLDFLAAKAIPARLERKN
jgi:hypothetical protein